MNTIRTVAEAGVTAAKGAASPENQRAALLAVTEKGRELAKAAPGAVSQASLHPKSPTLPLLPRPTIKAAGWVSKNPGTTACVAVGAVALPLIVAPMAAAAPVLGAAGFTSGGIAAGSAAAGSMGSGVAAGSAFAVLQSAAMGGYGVATVAGAVQGVGVAVAGVLGGVATWLQTKKP